LFSQGAAAQPPLPANVKTTCTVTSAQFNGWFESESVSLTGIVLPADSFSNTTMETFFQGGNCFNCHSRNMLGTSPGTDGFSGGLSHIWAPILPLFSLKQRSRPPGAALAATGLHPPGAIMAASAPCR
jgi:hypothetical protein